MNAYGYVRVSTTAQEDKTSLESQERAIKKYAKEQGLIITQVWREVFTGAELFDRPILNQVRSGIRAKSVVALVVYSIDRLSRDVGHLAFLADECERHGVALHFVTEQFDQSPEGKLLQSVRSYAAEVERLKIRERTVRGKRSRLEAGHLPRPSIDLYGYRLNRETGKRHVVPEESRVVKQIFSLCVNDGLGVLSIARRLQAAGIAAPSVSKRTFKDGRQPRWSKTSVLRILREPAYAGLSYGWRWASSGKGAKRIPRERPRSEWIVLPDALTPAIITTDIFQAAQTALATRRIAHKGTSKHVSLLRGFIWCVCGARRSPDVEGFAYRCNSRFSPATCQYSSVPMRRVERWAWEQIVDILSSPEMVERIASDSVKKQTDTSGIEAELEQERAILRKIDAQQARLVEQVLDASPEWLDAFKRKQGELASRKRSVQEHIDRLQSRMKSKAQALDAAGQFERLCESIRPRLKSFSVEEKRIALTALNARIVAAGRDGWRLTISPLSI